MMNEKLEKAINDQINAEMYSSYFYLSMSAWLEEENLPGMALWMRYQAQEEEMHAMKFFDYLLSRNGRVRLGAIDAPPTEWDSPLAVFGDAYKHEKYVTSLIHKLVDLAHEEHDHPTSNLLQWFVDEQVEEEASTLAVMDKLQMIGDNNMAIFMVDRELGARPAPTPIDATSGG